MRCCFNARYAQSGELQSALSLSAAGSSLARKTFLFHVKPVTAAFDPPPAKRTLMEASIGHNSGEDAPATQFARDQLKSYIERIERLEEQKKAMADDIRDVYTEAKGNSFDVKAMREIIRLRKQDPDERHDREAILETYMQALGML
jgi:uncharacterized protein (UPF0335 family)